MQIKRVIAPSVEPVSLAQARDQTRVDVTGSPPASDHDTKLSRLISAAVQFMDGDAGILGRALVPQTWKMVTERFADSGYSYLRRDQDIYLPLPPFIQVDSITYFDADNVSQTLDASLYQTIATAAGAIVRPVHEETWPDTYPRLDAVTIQWQAGYQSGASPEDGSAVPEPIVHAMLMLIAHWFEMAEASFSGSITDVPLGVQALIAPYRAGGLRL